MEKDANTDSCRRESPPQSGQWASSSIWLMGLSFSNVLEHMLQLYSYIGILSSP